MTFFLPVKLKYTDQHRKRILTALKQCESHSNCFHSYCWQFILKKSVYLHNVLYQSNEFYFINKKKNSSSSQLEKIPEF